MTHDEIAQAVIALKGRYPRMAVDELYSDTPDTVERLIAEALRHPEQVAVAAAWLDRCRSIKHPRRDVDTYGYKHEVEDWCGMWVSHTSFLVAAQMSRFDMVRDGNSGRGLLPLGANRPCK